MGVRRGLLNDFQSIGGESRGDYFLCFYGAELSIHELTTAISRVRRASLACIGFYHSLSAETCLSGFVEVGKPNPEFGSALGMILGICLALMRFENGANKAESETDAGRFRRGGRSSHEASPNPLKVFLLQSRSGVANPDLGHGLVEGQGKIDASSWGRVSEGIVEQIAQCLLEPLTVYRGGMILVGKMELKIEGIFFGRGGIEFKGGSNQVRNGKGFALEFHHARVASANAEDPLNQCGGALDFLDGVDGVIFPAGGIGSFEDAFDVSPDSCQWRAQLMGELIIGGFEFLGKSLNPI